MTGKSRTESSPAPIRAAPSAGRDQIEVLADRDRGDDERQRGRLHQAGDRQVAAVQEAAVEQRREPPCRQQGGQEDRHHDHVGGAGEQGVEVVLDAAGDEEHRDEDPEADGLELAAELRVGHLLVLVEQGEDRSCHEGPEDGFQPERVCDRGEAHQQNHCAADSNLGGRVLEADQILPEQAGALRGLHGQQDDRRQQHEAADQEQRGANPSLPREEDREQDHGAEVGDRPRRDDQLAEGGGDLAGVLQDRDQDSERGSAEDDRDQERGLDQPRRLEQGGDQDGDRKRDDERGHRHAQHLPAQLVELDLKAGEESRKASPSREITEIASSMWTIPRRRPRRRSAGCRTPAWAAESAAGERRYAAIVPAELHRARR